MILRQGMKAGPDACFPAHASVTAPAVVGGMTLHGRSEAALPSGGFIQVGSLYAQGSQVAVRVYKHTYRQFISSGFKRTVKNRDTTRAPPPKGVSVRQGGGADSPDTGRGHTTEDHSAGKALKDYHHLRASA